MGSEVRGEFGGVILHWYLLYHTLDYNSFNLLGICVLSSAPGSNYYLKCYTGVRSDFVFFK